MTWPTTSPTTPPTTGPTTATSTEPFSVELDALTVRFGPTRAVDGVTATIVGGRITGLLGRNGAGKTTLMSAVAGYLRPTSGRIRTDGCDPYEHARVMADTCLVRDSIPTGQTSVKEAIEIAAELRPRWDAGYADNLLERFEVPRRAKVGKLSRGKQSALAVTLGLASRASLTMFDEPHLGMDAPSRYAFYEEIIADYMRHPRTIVLSSHLIDEIATVIEDVMVIDRGRLLFNEPIDELRTRGAELTGPAAAVDDATFGMPVLSERTLGRTKSVVVYHPLDERLQVRAAALGIDVNPLPLQDLFVHLTEPTARADVANTDVDRSAALTMENRP